MIKTEQPRSFDELLEIEEELFHKQFNESPDFTAIAPGRINIIGEHTDYNNGLAMPAAINRWVMISFHKRNDSLVNIKSINFDSELVFNLENTPSLTKSWQKYIYGALKVFSSREKVTTGFDALIWGNVPAGSGISSSAALEVAMMNGLRALYETNMDDLEVVKLCQRVEHEHLQVKSGLLDQYASQFSRKGKVMVLDLNSLTHQYVDMAAKDLEWVLVDSGIKRELAHSGYTQRVNETQEAFAILKNKIPEVTSFRDLHLEYAELLTNETLRKRIVHYITENQRVIYAMDAIQNNDFLALGALLNSSHKSLSEEYEVSCNELDFLAFEAQKFHGCLGSRMMGGGFGGCTLNLILKNSVEEFSSYIQSSFKGKYKHVPEISYYQLVEGACIHPYH